jgi:CRISPR/Cas system CMR subunit Cmr6 (Cas7 group RAMP superfamily)
VPKFNKALKQLRARFDIHILTQKRRRKGFKANKPEEEEKKNPIKFLTLKQGCQMAYFLTKNANLGKF